MHFKHKTISIVLPS